MSLLDEKKYTLDETAQKLGFTRRAFNDTVKPHLRLIVHNERRIEVPESSIEEYLKSRMMLGTPSDKKTAEQDAPTPVPAKKKPKRKSR